MDNGQVILSNTWRIDCKVDDHPTVYKVESQAPISEPTAVNLLIEKLNSMFEGLRIATDIEAIPVKAPLVKYF